MPPTTSTRPQTSRQARHAYLKSGGTVRLSDLELRQLERSAELQARADCIKERENKRKANLKKKQERMEKEKENRQRMGIASPFKETCGASQMRLGAFIDFGLGLKRKREVTPNLSPASSSENSSFSGSQKPGQKVAPTRSPLQTRSSNPVIVPANKPQPNIEAATKAPSDLSKQLVGTPKGQHIRIPLSIPSPKRSMGPPPKAPVSRPLNPRTPASITLAIQSPSEARVPAQVEPPKAVTLKSQPSIPGPHKPSMLPPPTKTTRSPAPPTSVTSALPPKERNPRPQPSKLNLMPLPSTKRTAPPPQPRPPPLESPTTFFPSLPQPPDDPWAAFLVSNTQIERELSTDAPAPKPLQYQKHGFASAKTPFPTAAKPPRNDTAALLAGLCTQDLDYDADLEPDSVPDVGISAALSFEDGTISDAELEDVARDVEERSSGIAGEGQQMAKESFYDEFFDLSTQELCELVC